MDLPHLRGKGEEDKSEFLNNMEKTMPDIVMVQMDPMPFMHQCRQFAIKYLPTIAQ
jgi:hypothetical protein